MKLFTRKYLSIVFLISLYHNIYANGNREIPYEYRDLGTFSVINRRLNINLPYIKPDGINKIITESIHGIIIDRIIIDNKTIKPKKIFFDMGAYEHIDYVYEETVAPEEDEYFLEMHWGWNNEDNELNYSYFSRNGKIKYSPDYYRIPYGSNEIYIIYRVRLVGNEPTDFRNYYASKTYTVKINLIWK